MASKVYLEKIKKGGPLNPPDNPVEEQIFIERRLDYAGALFTWSWEDGEWRLCLWGIRPANPPKDALIDDVYDAKLGKLGKMYWCFDGENWCPTIGKSRLSYD